MGEMHIHHVNKNECSYPFLCQLSKFISHHSFRQNPPVSCAPDSLYIIWMDGPPQQKCFQSKCPSRPRKKANGNIEMQLLYLNRTYTWA